jgi:hypothetical protein
LLTVIHHLCRCFIWIAWRYATIRWPFLSAYTAFTAAHRSDEIERERERERDKERKKREIGETKERRKREKY